MTWVRIDDGCPHHPKQIRAGAEACWLWQSSLCYSNAHRLNGRIGKDLLTVLYPPLASKAKKLAAKLVEVGLWHDHGDHYEIHDYQHFQEQALKEAVEARREYERERKRKQRKAGHVPDDVPDSVPDGSGGVPDPCPTGTSRAPAIPARPGPARPSPDGECVRTVGPAAVSPDQLHEAYLSGWKQRNGQVKPHKRASLWDPLWQRVAESLPDTASMDRLLTAFWADAFCERTGFKPGALESEAARLLTAGPEKPKARGPAKPAPHSAFNADPVGVSQ